MEINRLFRWMRTAFTLMRTAFTLMRTAFTLMRTAFTLMRKMTNRIVPCSDSDGIRT